VFKRWLVSGYCPISDIVSDQATARHNNFILSGWCITGGVDIMYGFDDPGQATLWRVLSNPYGNALTLPIISRHTPVQ